MNSYPPEIVRLYERLRREAEASGYHLNPDTELTMELVAGLDKNQKRYGYPMCPCRLAFGEKSKDLDLICPCDYRDQDLEEFGACYCGLYVSQAYLEGRQPRKTVPERRPPEFVRNGFKPAESSSAVAVKDASSLPVWRCRVCGYLCAREQPPEVCPICKARRERFELFPIVGKTTAA